MWTGLCLSKLLPEVGELGAEGGSRLREDLVPSLELLDVRRP
jgi:hypothetical protein